MSAKIACSGCGDMLPASELTTGKLRCEWCKGVHIPEGGSAVSPVTAWEDDPDARRLVEENPDGMTLEAIGDAFGVTRERVRQIEQSAIETLRRRAPEFGLSLEDLMHALAAKPETPAFPSGYKACARGGRQLSAAALEPSEATQRIGASLDALDASGRRLRAWCDLLDELARIRTAHAATPDSGPRARIATAAK